MNTVIQTNLEVETTAPAQQLIMVPLRQLRVSRRKNVRKGRASRQSVAVLAASIARVGLLQNLTVILAADGEHYEVVAGGRRFAALQLLVKQDVMAEDGPVPCLVVADASARTASLTENVQREAMHPADQFEAFAALVAEGRPIEDIAADFAVTPLVVRRRLKLGNVSPRLLADYRADSVTLDQLMALAITDSHVAQEAAFYGAPEWQRSPSALRDRLTEREIDASHPQARFVGLDAYAAAGGGTRRDLFAEDDSGVSLIDEALLERLVREKLARLAEDVRAEGWAWVDAVPHLNYDDRQAFQNAPRQWREPTAREARHLAVLQGRLDRAEAALEAAYNTEDEDKVASVQRRYDRLTSELNGLREALRDYTPEVRTVAGAIVTVGRDGDTAIHRGLLREAEAKALRTLERVRIGLTGANDDDSEEPAPPKTVGISDRLARRFGAHRTAGLQIEVARHPQVALAALVHGMVQTVLLDGYGQDLPLGVRLTVQDKLDAFAPDWPESPAAVALRELQQAWGERLPENRAELFGALLTMEQDELVRLLAVCVAATVDGMTNRAAADAPDAELAQAVGLDMAIWWQPTAESYFLHVSKAVILDAVAQFAPEHADRLAKLKKTELASEAGRLVRGTGWMPAVFTAEGTENEEPDQSAVAGEEQGGDTDEDEIHVVEA